jgi:hypothetical protein
LDFRSNLVERFAIGVDGMVSALAVQVFTMRK